MPDDPLPQSELIIYQTEDEKTRIQVRLDGETVWLTQAQMAELFQTTKQNVSLHVQNCFAERELSENSVVKESLTTAFSEARPGIKTAASGTRSEPVGTTGGHTDYKSVLRPGLRVAEAKKHQTNCYDLDQRSKPLFPKRIRNIFDSGGVQRAAVVANFATAPDDGKTFQVDSLTCKDSLQVCQEGER